MPSDMPRFTYRTKQENLEKLERIASKEKRSVNQQIDKIVCDWLEKYESEHGEIKI